MKSRKKENNFKARAIISHPMEKYLSLSLWLFVSSFSFSFFSVYVKFVHRLTELTVGKQVFHILEFLQQYITIGNLASCFSTSLSFSFPFRANPSIKFIVGSMSCLLNQ